MSYEERLRERNEPRRFHAGQTFERAFTRWQIVQGAKGEHDLILQVGTPAFGWVNVPMSLAFLLCDFFYENEEHVYDGEYREGGEYFRARVEAAMSRGWVEQAARVRVESEARGCRDALRPE